MTTHGDHGEGRVDVGAYRRRAHANAPVVGPWIARDVDDLCNEVEVLRAENARLVEALEEIAKGGFTYSHQAEGLARRALEASDAAHRQRGDRAPHRGGAGARDALAAQEKP